MSLGLHQGSRRKIWGYWKNEPHLRVQIWVIFVFGFPIPELLTKSHSYKYILYKNATAQVCRCDAHLVHPPCLTPPRTPAVRTQGSLHWKLRLFLVSIDPDVFKSMSSIHRPCILHYFNKRFDEFRCHSFLCMLKRYFVTMLWYLWHAGGTLSEVV